MELIVLITTIVGLIAGLIAISDKAKDFLLRRNRIKHIFENEFKDWLDSGKSYISPRDTFLKILHFIKINSLDQERESFCVALVTHYGDQVFKELINRNRRNVNAYDVLLRMLDKKGVRVGWRAEYALGTLDRDILDASIASLPPEFANNAKIQTSISRVRDNQVIEYLENVSNGRDQKMQSYAREVLRQIRS